MLMRMVGSSARGSLALGGLLLASLAPGAGCDWNTFDDIQETAAVRVYEPSSYAKSQFGSVLTTVETAPDTADVRSHLVASAGPSSPVVFEDVWEDDQLASGSSTLCRDTDACKKGVSVGGALIPFEFWATGTKKPGQGCVLSPGIPNAFVFCRSNVDGSENYPLDLGDVSAPKANMVFAGAGLPPKYPLGVALISAHSVLNVDKQPLNGTLFYQPDRSDTSVPFNQRLDLIDPRTGLPFASGGEDAGDYGYRVAVAESTGESILIAVSQPAKNRVIVGRYDPAISVPDTIAEEKDRVPLRLQTLACVKSPDASLVGFGKVLTFGDVTGDGEAELFIGIDPTDGKNGAKQRLYMYPGTGVPAFDADATQCSLWDEQPAQVGCIGGIRGVDCNDTQFGASVAVGDIDGDAIGDLIVGAPGADVQGVADAGVIWLIPGTKSGLDLDGMTNLYASGQKSKGRLGATVAAVSTRGRKEPAGGAPGANRLYVFTCSELESESTKSYCLPKK
jgi:hypothetical protein